MYRDRILLIEDNHDLAASLAETLEAAGFEVDHAWDGPQALALATDAMPPFDALLLDIGIPRLNGLEVCRRLRAQGNFVPVVMLTALGAPDDIVAGLERGSDDYVVKPIDTRVLVARLRAAIRRHRHVPGEGGLLRAGPVTLDTVRLRAAIGEGEPVALTPLQARLLELLLRHAPRVLSRAELTAALWDEHEQPGEASLRTHIYQLRRLLAGAGGGPLIRTQGKQGYYAALDP